MKTTSRKTWDAHRAGYRSAIGVVGVTLAAAIAMTPAAQAQSLEGTSNGQSREGTSSVHGGRAQGAILDLTAGTLTWMDSRGQATTAPSRQRALAILEGGKFEVSGSVTERVTMANGDQIEAATRPVRFVATNLPEDVLNEARDIIAEKTGGMEATKVPSFIFAQIDRQSGRRPQAEVVARNQGQAVARVATPATEESRQRRDDPNQAENDRVRDDVKNLPGQIIRDGVQDAAAQARWQIRAKVNEKVNKILGKIR